MFALSLFAVPLNDPVILGLIVAVVVAFAWCSQVADQANKLKERNASLARQVEALAHGKTAHDELLEAWGRKITARLETLSAEDLANLDGVLRAKLPQAVDTLLAQPSQAFLNALRAKLEPHAEALADTALRSGDSPLCQALLERLQSLLANAEHPSWSKVLETLTDPLFERVAGLAQNPSPALAAHMDAKIGTALEEQVRRILQTPDDYPEEIAETINETLGNRITAVAENLPAATASQMDKKIGEALVKRIGDIFADPDQHQEVIEGVDESLGNRVAAVAENMPAEAASQMDKKIGDALVKRIDDIIEDPEQYQDVSEAVCASLGNRVTALADEPPEAIAAHLDLRIGEQLLETVNWMFENPADHEALFDSVDEALGTRILEQAGKPSDEVAAQLDRRIGEKLVDNVNDVFENPAEHETLFEQVNGRISRRIEQRLEGELGNGSDSGLEKALNEMLRGHLGRRFQQTDLGGLDRALDTRLQAMAATPPQDMLAAADRMFEAALAAQARERLSERIKECAEEVDAALLRRLQARIRALPQEGSAVVDELIDLKLPGWFQDRVDESFEVHQAVARQVALRIEGWIGSALEQPKPVLKNALETWITHQVLNALKANAVGTESNPL
jgi:hypothetical protein